MDNVVFKTKIPFVVNVNGKDTNLAKQIKEYLKSPQMKELSEISLIGVENEIYMHIAKNSDIIDPYTIDPKHLIATGKLGEVTDEYVEFICTKVMDESAKIDLNSIRFGNMIVNFNKDNEIDSILMTHIYGALEK